VLSYGIVVQGARKPLTEVRPYESEASQSNFAASSFALSLRSRLRIVPPPTRCSRPPRIRRKRFPTPRSRGRTTTFDNQREQTGNVPPRRRPSTLGHAHSLRTTTHSTFISRKSTAGKRTRSIFILPLSSRQATKLRHGMGWSGFRRAPKSTKSTGW